MNKATPPVVDLVAAYALSPMATVNEILLSGNFSSAPVALVDEKETVIGELTLFEKAVYTARNNVGDKHNALADSNNEMVREARREGKAVDKAKVEENKLLVELESKKHEVLNALLWASIQQRLGAPALESSGIGIREGYKIVQMLDKEDSSGISFKEMLMSDPLMAMLAAKAVSHDCDGCPGYDECNLPDKKERAAVQ